MAGIAFQTIGFDYSALAAPAEGHVLAYLAAGRADEIGFPLMRLDRADHVSDSPFMDRQAAIAGIVAQNRDLPAPPANARFVIAGQQAGLLTGPLYTFLKAASAIAMSERLSRESDSPVRPLFWVVSEDHDVLEVNRVTVHGRRFVHEYAGELTHGRVPQVADISIEDAREPLLAFLREALPETEFRPWVLDVVASADYSNYATAFSDMFRRLFAGKELRLVDAIALRPLTAPVLAVLVERWPEVCAALRAGGERLRAAGVEPPLAAPGVFAIVDGKRVAIELGDRSARLCAGELSFAELADEIRRRPGGFSPNAALRPVLQDAVLPVVATFGGPFEIDYLWQIDPIYEVAGVTRSRVFPRISATFVEDRIRRAAEKVGLWSDRVFEVRKELAGYAPETEDDGEIAALAQKGKALLDEIQKYLEAGEGKWLVKAKAGLEFHLEKIVDRLREERLEAAGLGRKRLERIADAVLPEGKPQERVANVLQFLNLYGPEFVTRAIETLDPFSLRHQVVSISTMGKTTKGEDRAHFSA